MDPPPTVLPLRLWDLDREVLGDWFPVPPVADEGGLAAAQRAAARCTAYSLVRKYRATHPPGSASMASSRVSGVSSNAPSFGSVDPEADKASLTFTSPAGSAAAMTSVGGETRRADTTSNEKHATAPPIAKKCAWSRYALSFDATAVSRKRPRLISNASRGRARETQAESRTSAR
mmetsp:Transcript_9473/g.26425  ORF Transcript_9473/g.26425 Transcript_9473/m.26425 type:complete len:175 (-) Transcript_9473:1408-1932(-)